MEAPSEALLAGPPAELAVPADTAYLELVGQFASYIARQMRFGEPDIGRIRLAVDEACANALLHGMRGEPGEQLRVSCQADGSALTVRVHDTGPMFDLDRVAQPDVDAPIERRKVGGLGLYLMRKIMDSVTLEPAPGGKELVLVKRRGVEAQESEGRTDAD